MTIVHLFIVVILLLCTTINEGRVLAKHDPDCDLNITQLIQSKGYPCEEHKATTNDGYILGLFRIPHGRNSTKIGRPVLLQHGLLDSSVTWVLNFPDQSLAYILADAGYDVWLGNMRGNVYSRAHTKYNPDVDEAFWDFSWDEMAQDDLPSMINYILTLTQHSKIAYVGHSQGTMIALSEFGRLGSTTQNNVSFWAALAPVAHLAHTKSPLKYLFNIPIDPEQLWHDLFGRKQFLPASNIVHWFGKHACGNVIIDPLVCENLLFVICGPEKKNRNETRMEVYVTHEPGGTSVKNMIHYAQMFHSKLFQAYDYGSPEKNQQHYNQTTPPIYPIRPMKVPTAIFWSGEDWLADPEDVSFIFDNVQSLVYEKYIPDYNHLDFSWAMTANKLIYNDVVDLLQKYHTND